MWLDFKQQHFQILARRYISSGQKIYIFWPEDIYLLARRYISHLSLPIPISSGQKIYIFWPEDTDYRFSNIGKCQIWMMWMVRFVTFVHCIVYWQMLLSLKKEKSTSATNTMRTTAEKSLFLASVQDVTHCILSTLCFKEFRIHFLTPPHPMKKKIKMPPSWQLGIFIEYTEDAPPPSKIW